MYFFLQMGIMLLLVFFIILLLVCYPALLANSRKGDSNSTYLLYVHELVVAM